MKHFPTIVLSIMVLTGAVMAQKLPVPEQAREQFSPVLLRMEANTQVGPDSEPTDSGHNTATAVVMSSDGLLITTLSAVDPLSMLGDRVTGDQFRLKVSGLKVVLPDATEMPAQVILRDKQTGFAIIKLTDKPKQPLAALPLADVKPLEVGDDIYLVDRLGPDEENICVVSSQMVMARLSYPINKAVVTGGNVVGAIAINQAGEVCGLVSMYRPDAKRTYAVYTVIGPDELKALLAKARVAGPDVANSNDAAQPKVADNKQGM
ncbi:MAG: S1 family peptidase [Armatimonadota bacterium]